MAEAEDRRGEEMDAGEKKAKQKGGFRAMPFILGDLFTLPDDAIISFFFLSFFARILLFLFTILSWLVYEAVQGLLQIFELHKYAYVLKKRWPREEVIHVFDLLVLGHRFLVVLLHATTPPPDFSPCLLFCFLSWVPLQMWFPKSFSFTGQ